MAIIELERITDEGMGEEQHHEDDPKICHLYHATERITHCGIPAEKDKHGMSHWSAPWFKGMMSCPVCGVPVCMDCLLIAS